jgi:hypothetical protein
MATDPRIYRMTEDELMEQIRALCSDLRLHAFHVRDSRRSVGPGFPDLVIAGPGGLLFRECKNATNSLSPQQRVWGSVLTRAGASWSTWRPRDLFDGTIAQQLSRIAGHTKEAA